MLSLTRVTHSVIALLNIYYTGHTPLPENIVAVLLCCSSIYYCYRNLIAVCSSTISAELSCTVLLLLLCSVHAHFLMEILPSSLLCDMDGKNDDSAAFNFSRNEVGRLTSFSSNYGKCIQEG